MTLAPFLAAPLVVQIHALAALSLIPLTIVQFSRRKGGVNHRLLGWIWVAVMALTALSSFWIVAKRPMIFTFSWIHLLSIITLVQLVVGIYARRVGNITRHRSVMIGLTLGWAIAGLFTFLPTRIMNQVFFGA